MESIWGEIIGAADKPVWLASADEVNGVTGKYVHHRKVKNSWSPNRDEDVPKKLPDLTQDVREMAKAKELWLTY